MNVLWFIVLVIVSNIIHQSCESPYDVFVYGVMVFFGSKEVVVVAEIVVLAAITYG